MGFELPNGKTARNLQDQVKFLSEKLKDLYAAFNESGLKKIEIVEELPEVGDPTVLYLLARQDPEQDDYYEEYLWYDNAWEKIGTTHIDLSDYCTLSTNQTITGEKTFSTDTYFTGNPHLNTTAYLSECYCYGSLYSAGSNDLGSSSYQWKDLYLSGTLRINGIPFYKGGTVVYAGATLAPDNNTSDLGTSSFPYKDLYLSGDIYLGNEKAIRTSANRPIWRFNYGNGFVDTDFSVCPVSSGLDLGASFRKWNNLYLAGNISDGTNSATVEALVKKSHLYTHNVVCSNGTLVLIGNTSFTIDSQSSLGMSASFAVKMTWNNNTVLQIVNGTTIYYFDTSDSTIKTATIGTFTSDTISDY